MAPALRIPRVYCGSPAEAARARELTMKQVVCQALMAAGVEVTLAVTWRTGHRAAR